MGRSIVTAQTPILGSIFRNANTPDLVNMGNGTVYKSLASAYPSYVNVLNSDDFPVAVTYLKQNNGLVSLGSYSKTSYSGFGSQQLNTYNVDNRFMTWGVGLARGATTFQSNKTENYYNNSIELNGNFIGYFNEGRGSYNYSRLSRCNVLNGSIVDVNVIQPNRDTAVYYFDSVNSRHVWICGNQRLSTSDGLSFTQATISGLNSREYHRVPFHNRPFIAQSGANGMLFQRAQSSANTNFDYVEVFRTTDNWATATNITSTYVPSTTYGYPHIYNYDGTRVFALFGGTDGSSANMVGTHTTNFGSTVTNSTVSGDVSVFHGMAGVSTGNTLGLLGSHTATCSGANASSFMYLSSSYGEYYAYYTNDGGQTFTAKNLKTQIASVFPTNSTYDGFVGLSYANGVWVALFQRSDVGIYVMRSTNNGSTWSNPAYLMGINGQNAYQGIYFAHVFTHNNQFIALKNGSGLTIWKKSADGITWTDIADPFPLVGNSNTFFELADHFVVMGRVIRKSDLTIVDFHNQPGYVTSSAVLANMAISNNKSVTGFADWGCALITSQYVTDGKRTVSMPQQYNSYATSGSVYGAYEYMRVK